MKTKFKNDSKKISRKREKILAEKERRKGNLVFDIVRLRYYRYSYSSLECSQTVFGAQEGYNSQIYVRYL